MTLVSQFVTNEKYSVGEYFRNFLNNIKFYFKTFFIQYEKFVFRDIYAIYPHSDTDSETNEYDIVDENGSESEDCEDDMYEEESENEEESETDETNDEELCRENCDCKLCFYFKDIVESAYYKLKQKRE